MAYCHAHVLQSRPLISARPCSGATNNEHSSPPPPPPPPLFLFFRVPVHIQLVWWHWWNWLTCTRSSLEPQSFSASAAPCSQNCSLWSPRASLQAWLLRDRAAHLELQSFSASVASRAQSCVRASSDCRTCSGVCGPVSPGKPTVCDRPRRWRWTFTGTCAQLCAGLLALPLAVPKFFLQAQWGKVPELLPQLYLRLYKIHTRKGTYTAQRFEKRRSDTSTANINKRTHKIILWVEQTAGPKFCLALSDLWHQHISSNKNWICPLHNFFNFFVLSTDLL